MAELRVLASYVGPGEQRTAETLAKELPEDWFILANAMLPIQTKDDVDLLIVGRNLIFVIDEKSWGPSIKLGNDKWYVSSSTKKDDVRPNPLHVNASVSKKLAGLLKNRVSGYQKVARNVAGSRLVFGKIVLSHARLELDLSDFSYSKEDVLVLEEASAKLQSVDKAFPSGLMSVREAVIKQFMAFEARAEFPSHIGEFKVLSEIEPVGTTRVFLGEEDDNLMVLRAYPMDGWGPDVDVNQLVSNERKAAAKAAKIDRSWEPIVPFSDDARRWRVLPLKQVPQSISLERIDSMKDGQEGPLFVIRGEDDRVSSRAASFVRDAFLALSEIHELGIIHRGLMPRRIQLSKGDRVILTDFLMARGGLDQTVGPAFEDVGDASVDFRAPECSKLVSMATEESDVYAMALSLLSWLNGKIAKAGEEDLASYFVGLNTDDPIEQLLKKCLAAKPKERPTAQTIISEIDEMLGHGAPQGDELHTENATARSPKVGDSEDSYIAAGQSVGVGGRYLIERPLGRGSFGMTWLATDKKTESKRVIKSYYDVDSAEKVKQEFNAAARLSHKNCARVWDFSENPPFLVSEYVEGQSLKTVSEQGNLSEEDYRTIAIDCLAGLAYMHDEGHLHRDISPGNIIVKDNGRAVIIDFGLTTSQDLAESVAGTPMFMAPEVITEGKWTPAADLYSLGAALLKSMLNRLPYETGTDRSVLPLLLEEEEVWDSSGTAILRALFKLVEPSLEKRPSSAAEFAQVLSSAAPLPKRQDGELIINPTILNLRKLYRGSSAGNVGNRGLDDEFAQATYVDTLLDTELAPAVLAGDFDAVLLTGNPGDGKTSFLSKMRNILLEHGAEDLEALSPDGWRMRLNNRTFAAVYDASAAGAQKSADEIVNNAMQGSGNHTALMAINDGQLFSFFTRFQDVYPDHYAAVKAYEVGTKHENSRIAIVDLKRRTIAPVNNEEGLAGRVIDSILSEERWKVCGGCLAQDSCPILHNRNLLKSRGKQPFLELVSISHLRRKRRATFRDLRSAIAWTITGDRSCDEVHEAFKEGRDLRRADGTLAFDLAFHSDNQDYLISEWSNFDPEILLAPGIERAMRGGSIKSEFGQNSSKRRIFFGDIEADEVVRAETRAYRFIDEFENLLRKSIDVGPILEKVLLGLSKILGAPGYRLENLALRDGEDNGWTVLREIPASEFSLELDSSPTSFIEHQPEGIRLRHELGNLNLTLDSYEIIRRAAEGELLGDIASEAVKLELAIFGDLLRTSPAHRVLVVDPTGRADLITAIDGKITRQKGEA